MPPTPDVPRTISYQGLLADNNGKALPDGEYSITLSLYADPTGTVKVWQDSYKATLSGGIFNLYLGGGNKPLPDLSAMNTPLWIGTQVGDSPEMHPLAPLAASPYALNVPDRAITTSKLADGAVTAEKVNMDYIGGIVVNGRPVTAQGTILALKSSKDVALDYDAITNSISFVANTFPTTGDPEKGGGASVLDATDPRENWMGRTNPVRPLVFAAAIDSFNTLPGGADNVIGNETKASTVSGGMQSSIGDDNRFSTIGGGTLNTIGKSNEASTIGGGEDNAIGDHTEFSTIAGGTGNRIAVAASFGFIGGGEDNSVDGFHSSVVGGDNHSINAANSFIGGGSSNVITGNNSAIAAGGRANTPNTINGSYSFIGAGNNNLIEVSGVENGIIAGNYNTLEPSVSTSMIGAGTDNVISEYTYSSFIGAGFLNRIDSNVESSFIGGGQENFIDDRGNFDFIGGGITNSIGSDGEFSTIAGGRSNRIIGNSDFNFIGGGDSNAVTGDWSSVVGGNLNSVDAAFSAVVGGLGNTVTGDFSTIAGGGLVPNRIEADNSFIGAGVNNRIQDLGADNGIVAGQYNRIDSSVVGVMIGAGNENEIHRVSDFSFIGSGSGNIIRDNSEAGAIVGGELNSIDAPHSFIGGGKSNTVGSLFGGAFATIGGGEGNGTFNDFTVIGGGQSNDALGDWSTVGGGFDNRAADDFTTIGGGTKNKAILQNATVGGGRSNFANGMASTIGGGDSNTAMTSWSTVGGGRRNFANGIASTIPGGESLLTTGYGQTAVGSFNAPRGTSLVRPQLIPAANDPAFMVGNGFPDPINPAIFTRSNAFEVSWNGHSLVFDVNNPTAPFGGRLPFWGGTYVDNIIYAWGDIDATGAVLDDFGVSSVVNTAPGVYTVTVRLVNPTTGLQMNINGGAITAVLVNEGPTAPCGFIHCSRFGTPGPNQFQVYTKDGTCVPINLPFMFHVTARP